MNEFNVLENEIDEQINEETDGISQEVRSIEIKNYKAAIEAVLFSMGTAVSIKELSRILDMTDSEVISIVDEMSREYEAENRGIKLVKLEDSYQLCSKNEYYDVLTQLVNMPKKHTLTDTLMETLSIVAYKQPVTRQEIEAIRGVSCVHAINKLVEYRLIQEVGRLDAIGRPILFGTTEDFLRCFGVSSTDDLPVITREKIEDFRKEAMEEVNIKVET
ncbi:MAG: SMC-Scp complex subunit ScpB [Lachnospiraceae bacterium]|nr:SMC-Scp complex subunit ScpB [Lachnospiraceae bacterium]